MENILGLLRVRVVRGVHLACKDTRSSDPYLVVTLGDQRVKTNTKKGSTNPEWNEDLTLSVGDPTLPMRIEVFDKDTFTKDDRMGEAEINIQPILGAVKMDKADIPNGTVIKKVSPSKENHLATESSILLSNGKVVQYMILKLRNIECGEVELQLQWISLPGGL